MVIKRVGPLSVAKVMGLLYAVLGLFYGTVFALIGLAGAMVPDMEGMHAIAGVLGIGAIIVLPVALGLFGFVITLIGALLYNLVASMVGGIEMDVA